MTNQEKKAYLMRYRAADNEINDLLREKERIMARLTKMTSSVSDMPHGPHQPDKLTDGVAAIIELDAEIDRKVDELCEMRQKIIKQIDSIGDDKQRRVLKLRYISGMKWERIAIEMHYDRMQIWRIHGDALSSMML